MARIEGVRRGRRLLHRLRVQHVGDVRLGRCFEANVATRLLRQEPAVLKDLVEDLGRLQLSALVLGDGPDYRFEHLVHPTVGGYGFVGLENYVSLWSSRRWNIAYTNLFFFSVFYVLGTMAVGLLLAILIDQRVRGESFWRTIFLYPLAVSFVVTGTVWSWLYNPSSGIEFLVKGLGWESFSFRLTIDRKTAMYAVIATGIWQASGFAMALFLAGLRSVDGDLVKAAQIDGAGPWRTYQKVILPVIAPIFVAPEPRISTGRGEGRIPNLRSNFVR